MCFLFFAAMICCCDDGGVDGTPLSHLEHEVNNIL